MDTGVHLWVSQPVSCPTEAGKQIPSSENHPAVTCPKPRGYLQYLTTAFQRCFPGAMISVWGHRGTLLSCSASRKNMVSLGENEFSLCLDLPTTDLGINPISLSILRTEGQPWPELSTALADCSEVPPSFLGTWHSPRGYT